ncbi:hypothetical protein ACIOD2_22750 [Amycolatopsis sp. NPDC088138]|uniref:hypothetical protein n=1 Tax=Amycolatopsis sp. NPDC088138 TaxID=3363938 RepID=UPI00381CEC1C
MTVNYRSADGQVRERVIAPPTEWRIRDRSVRRDDTPAGAFELVTKALRADDLGVGLLSLLSATPRLQQPVQVSATLVG